MHAVKPKLGVDAGDGYNLFVWPLVQRVDRFRVYRVYLWYSSTGIYIPAASSLRTRTRLYFFRSVHFRVFEPGLNEKHRPADVTGTAVGTSSEAHGPVFRTTAAVATDSCAYIDSRRSSPGGSQERHSALFKASRI